MVSAIIMNLAQVSKEEAEHKYRPLHQHLSVRYGECREVPGGTGNLSPLKLACNCLRTTLQLVVSM